MRRDVWIGGPMLVFCHCPKTAGTSLFRAISKVLGPRNSYLIKRERPSIATLRERNVKFVAGHVWYGHYAAQTDAAGADGLHFFTFVRDPVQLTLSLYQHCRQHRHIWRPAAWFFDVELPSRGIAGNTPQAVREFLDRCHTLTGIRWDNFQVRFAVDRPDGELDRSDLAAARRNLAAMDIVGITESFENSLRLIAIRFGWRSITYSHYGSAPEGSQPIPNADLLRYIEARCALDRALHAWATARFEADLEAADAACLQRDVPVPRVVFSVADRRFSLGWVRTWVALARMWTREDWRWWWAIKAVALGNDLEQRWRSARRVNGARDELRALAAILFDWHTGFVAKLCLVGGAVLPFMPFDLIPNRIPVLGHLDDAGYVVGGFLLARLFVSAEPPSRPPADRSSPNGHARPGDGKAR
jgi:uncharacterized membrane protein YkvA (DUF1232 family)